MVLPYPLTRGDVIILLGGGVHDGVKDLTGVGAPSEDTLARLVTVVLLQKRLQVPVIVSGGAVFPWRKSEATVDRRFLMDLGVPGDKILVENKSRDTLENAEYVREICEKHHFTSPILITSAYHMKRALISFREFNMDTTPVPANFKTGNRKYGWSDYLPGDLRTSMTACREYVGILYHKLVSLPQLVLNKKNRMNVNRLSYITCHANQVSSTFLNVPKVHKKRR